MNLDSDKGVHYDSCHNCGTENEPISKLGGPGQFQQASIFKCGGDRPGSENDGCGQVWERTLPSLYERNERLLPRGGRKVPGTPIPTMGRAISAPSDAYRRNAEFVFGRDVRLACDCKVRFKRPVDVQSDVTWGAMVEQVRSEVRCEAHQEGRSVTLEEYQARREVAYA